MTKENQKILYENFKRLSVEGDTDIKRKHCKEYAAEILKSFPEFEKKEEVNNNKETGSALPANEAADSKGEE